MTELQQQRLQVCENNWVRKIERVCLKRAVMRRIVVLREETGGQRGLTDRRVRSRLQWAGHVERRMAYDRLPKRATELNEQGRKRRWRIKAEMGGDVMKVGEEEDWTKNTRDMGGWKRLSYEAVKKLQAEPHPLQREKRKRDTINSLHCRHIALGMIYPTPISRTKHPRKDITNSNV